MINRIQPTKSHTYRIAIGFLAITLLTSSGAFARTWKSADGKSSFEGELIEYDAGTGQVTVDRDGKELSFKREILSPEDIAFLADKATAGPPPGSEWKPIPDKASLPATYSIEYVRSWSRPENA